MPSENVFDPHLSHSTEVYLCMTVLGGLKRQLDNETLKCAMSTQGVAIERMDNGTPCDHTVLRPFEINKHPRHSTHSTQGNLTSSWVIVIYHR